MHERLQRQRPPPKGKGADLGGLEGADAHCATLAKAAGSTRTGWRAYLSTTANTLRVELEDPIVEPASRRSVPSPTTPRSASEKR
jgi:hypothetical protein